MNFSVKLSQFEGPLALLLELIEEQKLPISSVSLAQVTDAYLVHLDENTSIPPDELADFLVIASKLLLLKSKTLLPYLQESQEEEGDLESALLLYKQYADAAKKMEEMIGARRFVFMHETLPKIDIGFSPPKLFSVADMENIFRVIVRRLEPVVKPAPAVLEKTVSIHEKIKEIQSFLKKAEKMQFSEIVRNAASRSEIIVSFLALLELIKQRSIIVSQEGRFGDMMIAIEQSSLPSYTSAE